MIVRALQALVRNRVRVSNRGANMVADSASSWFVDGAHSANRECATPLPIGRPAIRPGFQSTTDGGCLAAHRGGAA